NGRGGGFPPEPRSAGRRGPRRDADVRTTRDIGVPATGARGGGGPREPRLAVSERGGVRRGRRGARSTLLRSAVPAGGARVDGQRAAGAVLRGGRRLVAMGVARIAGDRVRRPG